MQEDNKIDILETTIPQEVLEVLLKDHTTSREGQQHNIFWATRDYEHLGVGYQELDEIHYDTISSNEIIIPRIMKTKMQQTVRAKEMAEVFTPSWICNAQNNLIDEAWFGRKEVFNVEVEGVNGKHMWKPTKGKIGFPEGKKWRDYVREKRLEITCGEAPYLVSRYDATTGKAIPVNKRIGLLDRKLRIVGENTETTAEWLEAAQDAYKSIYGFEWQGDNLLLAREALLFTFQDYYEQKFAKQPQLTSLKYIAYIISWNLWQMDGLKGVVPYSCKPTTDAQISLFDEPQTKPCEGCLKDTFTHHTGTYCIVKDWRAKDPKTAQLGRKYRFVDLLK
ncbi:MAG: restriction endonuclease subunit M [Bacteroidales bacterium]